MRLTVVGVAVPQGSKTAFPIHRPNGKIGVVVTEGKRAPALRAWRELVAHALNAYQAQTEAQTGLQLVPANTPLVMTMTFYLPAPKHKPKGRLFPDSRPDLDKLARAVCDALAKIVYCNDGQIVDLYLRKRYATTWPPRLELEIRHAVEDDL